MTKLQKRSREFQQDVAIGKVFHRERFAFTVCTYTLENKCSYSYFIVEHQ